MKLQRDDLPLSGGEASKRSPNGRAPKGHFGTVADRFRLLRLGGLSGQLGHAAAAAQLIQCRVARNPEQPGPLLTPAPVKGSPPPICTLEGKRRHVLSRGSISQQSRHIGIDIVAAGAVERLESVP